MNGTIVEPMATDPAGDADLAQALRSLAARRLDEMVQTPRRSGIHIDPDNVKKGLGRLVLTLVRLLHELLERQAVRRIDAGSLADEQIEDLGLTLMRQSEEIDRLAREFGLERKDLDLDLGPLGRLV
jgi:hypothetical protein